MTPETNTALAVISAGAKTICDITSALVSKRKRNSLIRAGELKSLEVEIKRALAYARMTAIHQLEDYACNCLLESYNRFLQCDVNSPYGSYALSILNDEARYFRDCVEDFVRLT